MYHTIVFTINYINLKTYMSPVKALFLFTEISSRYRERVRPAVTLSLSLFTPLSPLYLKWPTYELILRQTSECLFENTVRNSAHARNRKYIGYSFYSYSQCFYKLLQANWYFTMLLGVSKQLGEADAKCHERNS